MAATRQQMFDLTGYRTPTIQRLRLGAGADGRLTAIEHDVVEQSSTLEEFAEQTATPTRMMYAAAARRTRHRLARLDVATPSWMRAPGECPGMYGLESAMDEMAATLGLDPIDFRERNEPEFDPETGHYRFGRLDWEEFKRVVAGQGPMNAVRLARRRAARDDNAWVTDAAVAYAEKHA